MNSRNSELNNLYNAAKSIFADSCDDAQGKGKADYAEKAYENIKFSNMNDYINEGHTTKTVEKKHR